MHLKHQHRKDGTADYVHASVKGVRRVCLCNQLYVEQFKTLEP